MSYGLKRPCSTSTARLWPGGFSQPFRQTQPGVHYQLDQWRGAASRHHHVTRFRAMDMAAKSMQGHGVSLLHQSTKDGEVHSQRVHASLCQCDTISQPMRAYQIKGGPCGGGRKRRCRHHTSRGLLLKHRCTAAESQADIDAAQ